MDIYPEDNTSYTTQYQDALLKYVVYENCEKHRLLSFITLETVPSNYLSSSAITSGADQCSCDPYDSSSKDEEYLSLKHMAETTPECIGRAAYL